MTETSRHPAPRREAETPEEALADPTPANRLTGEILATPPPWLRGVPIITDALALVERSMERILSAETAEELLADPDSIGLKDIIGQFVTPTTVIGIAPSTIREGDYYVIFDGVYGPRQEIRTFTVGSPYAGGRIVKAHLKGWLPRRMRVVALESAANPGQSSLWVVDAPAAPGQRDDEQPF